MHLATKSSDTTVQEQPRADVVNVWVPRRITVFYRPERRPLKWQITPCSEWCKWSCVNNRDFLLARALVSYRTLSSITDTLQPCMKANIVLYLGDNRLKRLDHPIKRLRKQRNHNEATILLTYSITLFHTIRHPSIAATPTPFDCSVQSTGAI